MNSIIYKKKRFLTVDRSVWLVWYCRVFLLSFFRYQLSLNLLFIFFSSFFFLFFLFSFFLICFLFFIFSFSIFLTHQSSMSQLVHFSTSGESVSQFWFYSAIFSLSSIGGSNSNLTCCRINACAYLLSHIHAQNEIFGCIYRNPTLDVKTCWQVPISETIAEITDEKVCYQLDDFNIDLLKSETMIDTKDFFALFHT